MFFSGGVVPGGLVISNKLLYLSDIRISWYVLCRDSGANSGLCALVVMVTSNEK